MALTPRVAVSNSSPTGATPTTQAALLYLSASDISGLLTLADCMAAVARAHLEHAQGQLPAAPAVLGLHLPDGGLHVKAAAMGREPRYIAAKANANFPGNPARHGLPTIQGLLLLFDGHRGTPLAVMDSVVLTILRTAAASAVAADLLARAEASVLGICGCGVQGEAHVAAMACVRRVSKVVTQDMDRGRAESLASRASSMLGVPARAVATPDEVFAEADLCVTCTPAAGPFVMPHMLRPGQFIAAVGADNPHKQEIDAGAMARCKVVADLVDQAATIGDLAHAVRAGAMRREDVHAELGQILAGQRPRRTSSDEIFLYDSTGTALQDVAAAAIVYERAIAERRGTRLPA